MTSWRNNTTTTRENAMRSFAGDFVCVYSVMKSVAIKHLCVIQQNDRGPRG